MAKVDIRDWEAACPYRFDDLRDCRTNAHGSRPCEAYAVRYTACGIYLLSAGHTSSGLNGNKNVAFGFSLTAT